MPDIANYLVIGLGGTGGKVIRSFKRIVRQDFGENLPDSVKVRYLYVDSSWRDLESSGSWLTKGEVGDDISLPKESRLAITENNLAARLSDPAHHPVTHRYIGDAKDWSDIFSSMNVKETAGGQIRRLGESLFEPHCRDFVEQVRKLVHDMRKESQKDGVHFHVCAGLAGGTGSGIFLQVIAQLRALYSVDPAHYPISLYLLLPEENSPWAANGQATNYYANGYAALQELNAYLISDERDGPNKGGPLYRMVDLTGDRERLEGMIDRVGGTFVISNLNEARHVISVDKEVPELFAQLLHQRIFVIDRANNPNLAELQKAVTMENKLLADESQQRNTKVKLRSVRFSSFGVKRLMVPEEEIRDHFTATLATQALLQMLYNNWHAAELGTGNPYFAAEKRYLGFSEFVASEDARQRWKLSDEQITLSQGILATEIEAQQRGWLPHFQHWSTAAKPFFKRAASATSVNGRDERLSTLEAEFDHHADKQYRGVGRDRFFDMKIEDLGQPDRHVAELRHSLEDWMMDQWLAGDYGIADLETLLDDLVADLRRRASDIPAALEKFTEEEKVLLGSIQQNQQAWEKIGLGGRKLGWTGLFTTFEEVLEAQKGHLIELHRIRTQRRSWQFAAELLRKITAELEAKVRPLLGEARTALDGLYRFFESSRQSTCQDDLAPSGVEGGGAESARGLQNNVVKLYHPAEIRRFAASLLEEEKNQRAWAAQSRTGQLDLAQQRSRQANGRERSFAMLVLHGLRSSDAKTVQERISRDQAQQEHQNRTGSVGRHIGVNIVDKLAEQFPQSAQLRTYIEQLMNAAQTFCQFRPTEFSGSSRPDSRLAVILPTSQDQSAFRASLAAVFKACQAPGTTVDIVDSNRRPNEITLLSFKSWFPLRFLEPLATLRKLFEARLKQGSPKRARMEVFTEDHHPELPSLFRLQGDDIWRTVLPVLQIAQATKLLAASVNPMTNRTEYKLERKDEQGLPHQFVYPAEVVSLLEKPEASPVKVLETSTILRALQVLSEDQQEALEEAVGELMAQDKYRPATEREKLKAEVQAQVENARAHRGGNMQDDVFLKIRESASKALSRLDYGG